MSKLVIVDGNAILHRSFHALPPLTTRDGEPINAVYGLVSMLLRVVDDLNPTHLVVCFDVKAPTFRHKEFKEYQSQRPPTHEDLSGQFEKAREFLKAAYIPVYSKKGFEADDLIGTLAKKTRTDEVVIVTGDRDILQLVDDKKGIKLYMPIAGLSNAKLFSEKETLERIGVIPKLITDYKALVGDPSDNYKGVGGIGPKTAINLLNEFGSYKGIYANLDKIPAKLREKLEKGRKDAKMSLKLAQIVTNVAGKYDFEKMKKWDLGSKDVLYLFENFGFKTLTRRVKDFSKKKQEESQERLF
ncbi:5'-3' exonuclease H3TH domain-containing protein [Patescibacteria group bacterium]